MYKVFFFVLWINSLKLRSLFLVLIVFHRVSQLTIVPGFNLGLKENSIEPEAETLIGSVLLLQQLIMAISDFLSEVLGGSF